MRHTRSSDFSPAPVSVAGVRSQIFVPVGRAVRRVRLYAFAILIFFAVSCGGLPEEEASAGSGTASFGFSERFGHTSTRFDDGSGESLWVIGGAGGGTKNDVWKSTDGKKWTEVTNDAGFPVRYRHTAVVFGNALWVIGGANEQDGYLNDVWKSTDGKKWTQVTDDAGFSGRYEHSAAVFDDGDGDALWVIGGDDGSGHSGKNDMWKSKDGKNWIEVTADGTTDNGTFFPARYGHTTAVFDNGDGSGDALWVIGGLSYGDVDKGLIVVKEFIAHNDVWKSTDGKKWTKVTDDAGFSGRYKHTAAVFGGALWVIGGNAGSNSSNKFNDVWKSTDGKDWTPVTGSAGFSKRQNHSTAVFGGALWVIGGNAGDYSLKSNDVWKSTDGNTWKQANADF